MAPFRVRGDSVGDTVPVMCNGCPRKSHATTWSLDAFWSHWDAKFEQPWLPISTSISFVPTGRLFWKTKNTTQTPYPWPHPPPDTHPCFLYRVPFFRFSHNTYFPDVSGLNSFSILAPAPNLNAVRFCSNSWALICFRFWDRPKFRTAHMCFPFRRPYLFSDFLAGHQLHKQMVVSVLHHVKFWN